MGQIYADIEIINGGDLEMVHRGHLDPDEIKRMNVRILVDTGSLMLCINEHLQEYFQLKINGKKPFQLANGELVICDIVGPIKLIFKNRDTTCDAIILPGDSEPLLGLIPMEAMDVLISPTRHELVVNPAHPEGALLRL